MVLKSWPDVSRVCVAQGSQQKKESRHQSVYFRGAGYTGKLMDTLPQPPAGHPRAMHWHGTSRNQACHHPGHRQR